MATMASARVGDSPAFQPSQCWGERMPSPHHAPLSSTLAVTDTSSAMAAFITPMQLGDAALGPLPPAPFRRLRRYLIHGNKCTVLPVSFQVIAGQRSPRAPRSSGAMMTRRSS